MEVSLTSDEDLGPPKPQNEDEILNLGDEGTLVLTETGLLVTDLPPRHITKCCGLISKKSSTGAQRIEYYYILYAWVDASDTLLTIDYLYPTKKTATHQKLTFAIAPELVQKSRYFASHVMELAFKDSKIGKRIKVLINPHGGRGKAEQIYLKKIQPVLIAAGCVLNVEDTMHFKHAEEIVQKMDIEAFDVVACCSGDGVPHEVFNGLARQEFPIRALRKIAVVQLPCGSGNGMCWNLSGSDDPVLAALTLVKGVRMPMDLVSITQGDTRILSFLSQALGIIAECDLATEHMRWLGDTRFAVGYVARLMRKTLWPVEIAVKVEIEEKKDVKKHYLDNVHGNNWAELLELSDEQKNSTTLPALRYGSITNDLPEDWKVEDLPNLGNFYAGNMAYMSANNNVFATSLPSDGCMDLLVVPGDISRRRALELADLASKGKLMDAEEASFRKISGYRIIPKQKDGFVSIDGERVPFQPWQAEVHRGLGTVLGRKPGRYMASGPGVQE